MARLKKTFGQHLMTSDLVVQDILDISELSSDDLIIEVGPGTGILSSPIVSKAAKAILIEIDHDMVNILQKKFSNLTNLEIVEGDILEQNILALTKGKPYKVIANLPYNSASRIIRFFVENHHQPQDMVVTIQKEVADNLLSQTGNPSLFSLAIKLYADTEFVRFVSPENFSPPPKVNSSVIKITPRSDILIPLEYIDILFVIAKACFLSRRKQMVNSLSNNLNISKASVHLWLNKAEIEGSRRPETLSVEEWYRLVRNYEY